MIEPLGESLMSRHGVSTTRVSGWRRETPRLSFSSSLRSLCGLCGELFAARIHRRDAENAELTQRVTADYVIDETLT